MNIDYERQNIFFAIGNIMFIKFYSLLSCYLWVPFLYALYAFGLSSCSNKVVDKLKTFQQPEPKLYKENESNFTQQIDYPLSEITPETIPDSIFAFLFIIGCCLIFTFPGLICFFYNHVKGLFYRKK